MGEGHPWRRGWGSLTWDSEVPLGTHSQVLRICLVTAVGPGGCMASSLSAPPTRPRARSPRARSPGELHVDAEVAPRRGLDVPGGHQQVVLLAQEDLAVRDHGDHVPEA